jgi:hypothetical protein
VTHVTAPNYFLGNVLAGFTATIPFRFCNAIHDWFPVPTVRVHLFYQTPGEMRTISFIGQPDVIKRILQHLALRKEFDLVCRF